MAMGWQYFDCFGNDVITRFWACSSAQEIWASFRMEDGFAHMDDVHANEEEEGDEPVKRNAKVTRVTAPKDVANTDTHAVPVPNAAPEAPAGPAQELEQFTVKHILKSKSERASEPVAVCDGLVEALGELLIAEHPEFALDEAKCCSGSDVAAVADAAISKRQLTDKDRPFYQTVQIVNNAANIIKQWFYKCLP